MYVGAASQHVLRMSCVPEHEAKTFGTEVIAFWSQLIKRDATSPLFHLPLKLGGLVWAQLCSAMRLLRGELGNRFFPRLLQPLNHQTRTPSSPPRHSFALNLYDYKPLSNNR